MNVRHIIRQALFSPAASRQALNPNALPACTVALPEDVVEHAVKHGFHTANGRVVCDEQVSSGRPSQCMVIRKEIAWVAGAMRARVVIEPDQEGSPGGILDTTWSEPMSPQQVINLIEHWALQRHDVAARAALAQFQAAQMRDARLRSQN